MLAKMSSAIGKMAPGCRRKAGLAPLSTETMAAACWAHAATDVLCVVGEHRELASGQVSSCSFQKCNWAYCHNYKGGGR